MPSVDREVGEGVAVPVVLEVAAQVAAPWRSHNPADALRPIPTRLPAGLSEQDRLGMSPVEAFVLGVLVGAVCVRVFGCGPWGQQ